MSSAGSGSAASGGSPALVAGAPSQEHQPPPPPPPSHPPAPIDAPAPAQQGVAAAGSGPPTAGLTSPSPSDNASSSSRGGGRGRHNSHPQGRGARHAHEGPRGAGDGAGGARHPSAGRHLYNPQQGRGGGPGRGHPHHPQQPVQVHQASGLPHGYVPAYLPGSASLVEELDARLMVVMRDGRHLIGTLSSYDQFSNMVLEDTVERRLVVIPKGPSSAPAVYYSDIPLGLYVVRGDSVVIMGRTNPSAAVGEAVTLQELEDIQRQQAMAAVELDWDVDTDLVA